MGKKLQLQPDLLAAVRESVIFLLPSAPRGVYRGDVHIPTPLVISISRSLYLAA